MKRLEDKVNVDAPDATWPFGNLNDDPGGNTGTPVDKELITDIQQTSEKIYQEYVDTGGPAANGLPDNDVNGFELWNAFRSITKPYRVYTAILSQTGTSAPDATVLHDELGDITLGYSGVGVYTLDSSGSSFTANKTTVIVGAGDGNPNERYLTAAGTTSSIQFFSYLLSGGTYTLTDGQMTSIFIEIRVYD